LTNLHTRLDIIADIERVTSPRMSERGAFVDVDELDGFFDFTCRLISGGTT